MDTIFKVGDSVEAFGCEGIVSKNNSCDLVDFPIEVTFKEHGHANTFTRDGRCDVWHKEPSLKLIKKAKKKVELPERLHAEVPYSITIVINQLIDYLKEREFDE